MSQAIDIMSALVEIESRSADIYLALSRKFRHVPKVADFWDQFTKDEHAHANILKDMQSGTHEDKQEIEIDNKSIEDISNTHKWIKTDLTQSIRNLDDAYELSHEIETKEVEMLFEILSTNLGKYIEKLRMIMIEEQGHLQKILEFSKVYGNAEWRRNIQAG